MFSSSDSPHFVHNCTHRQNLSAAEQGGADQMLGRGWSTHPHHERLTQIVLDHRAELVCKIPARKCTGQDYTPRSGAGLRGRVPEHTGGGFEAVVRAVLVVVHNLEEKHHRLRVLLEALLQQLRNPHHGSANGGTASGDTTTRALGRYLLVRLDPLDDAGDGLENRLAQLVDVLHHLEIRLIDTDAQQESVEARQRHRGECAFCAHPRASGSAQLA